MPFVACNELAIATKSIASVCPHAERTLWVPFQGGTAVGETREEGGKLQFSYIEECKMGRGEYVAF